MESLHPPVWDIYRCTYIRVYINTFLYFSYNTWSVVRSLWTSILPSMAPWWASIQNSKHTYLMQLYNIYPSSYLSGKLNFPIVSSVQLFLFILRCRENDIHFGYLCMLSNKWRMFHLNERKSFISHDNYHDNYTLFTIFLRTIKSFEIAN